MVADPNGRTDPNGRMVWTRCLGGEIKRILGGRKPFDEQSYRANLDDLPWRMKI